MRVVEARRRVALTSSTLGRYICGQGLTRGALDRRQHAPLAGRHKADGVAGAPRAARAAHAVDVGLGVDGDVEVHHVADAVDVEAARRDIGGHQDVELAVLSCVDRPLALGLDDVAADRRGAITAGTELLGERLGLVLRAGEDDHGLEVLDLKDAGERVDLLRVRHHQVALRDVAEVVRLGLDRDLFRVTQVLARKRRICAGIVAEKSATCLVAGV